jgi:hypothetical protein
LVAEITKDELVGGHLGVVVWFYVRAADLVDLGFQFLYQVAADKTTAATDENSFVNH